MTTTIEKLAEAKRLLEEVVIELSFMDDNSGLATNYLNVAREQSVISHRSCMHTLTGLEWFQQCIKEQANERPTE